MANRSSRREAVADFRGRCERLFGHDRLVPKMQELFERGHTSVEDWMAGKNIPLEVVWIIELLECLRNGNPAPLRWKIATAARRNAANWIALAKQMQSDGKSDAEIALACGVSRGRVHQVRLTGALPKRRTRHRITENQIAIALEMRNSGATYQYIANSLGVPMDSIYGALRKRTA
jgi:hypothetical protein